MLSFIADIQHYCLATNIPEEIMRHEEIAAAHRNAGQQKSYGSFSRHTWSTILIVYLILQPLEIPRRVN